MTSFRNLLLLSLSLSISCFENVEEGDKNNNSDDPNADNDGDGLTNGEEADLGTDPNASDSDEDGLVMAMKWTGEAIRSTYSWPGNGIWPDRSGYAADDGLIGTTLAVGETFPDFTTFDQSNDVAFINLWFCGFA